MKIEDFTQQAAVAPAVAGRTDRVELQTDSRNASSTAAANKPQQAKDTVTFTSLTPTPEQKQQDLLRTQRVEELKSSVGAGQYQVPAIAVAEKMITSMVVSAGK